MLIRYERLREASAVDSFRGITSELAATSVAYKKALAAAEEDEDLLAEALAIGKKLKALKSQKPDERWMRIIEAENPASKELEPSWNQIRATLSTIDPKWESCFTTLYPKSFAKIAQEEGVDVALQQQNDAIDLMRQVLGPIHAAGTNFIASGTDATPADNESAIQQRIQEYTGHVRTMLEYINEQLSLGETFVKEASELYLTDPAQHTSISSLLSDPSSRTHTFLRGLVSLYEVTLHLEFGIKTFCCDVDGGGEEELKLLFDRCHEMFVNIRRYCVSEPLRSFLNPASSTPSGLDIDIDVDAIRSRMNEENGAEALSKARARHLCRVCMINQQHSGIHPTCQALHSKLFSSS